MGTCSETRADRTRYIIDEDYRLKQQMIRNIQKSKHKQTIQKPEYNEYNYPNYYSYQNFMPINTFNNNEKIIIKNKNSVTDVYKFERQLGEGGYGQVYLVRHKKMNLLRAMKIIPNNSKNQKEKTDEEIELLKQLDHPNIIKLFEYFQIKINII